MAQLNSTLVNGALRVLGAQNNSGSITAASFTGDGSGLTSLNASNISSGTLVAERLATSGVTAGSYGPSSAVTLNCDSTISIPYVTVDKYGRVTKISSTTAKIQPKFIHVPDSRSSYPGQIVTSGQHYGGSFMSASTLGISGDGSYYDALILRSYSDNTGGNDNALLFSKNTTSLYHTQYNYGSTTSWGTPVKIIDANNISNYLPTVNNASLTLQVNGTTKATFTANSSTNQTFNVTLADLGLSNAMKYIGTTSTAISDGSTTSSITINSSSVTVTSGNVVIYGNKEFIWNGSAWEELGDESSHAMKGTYTISASGSTTAKGTIASTKASHTHTVTTSATYTPAGTVTSVSNHTHTYSSTTTISATGSTTTNGAHTHKVTPSFSYTPSGTTAKTSNWTPTITLAGTYNAETTNLTLTASSSTYSGHNHIFTGTTATISGTFTTTSDGHSHTVSVSGSNTISGTTGSSGAQSLTFTGTQTTITSDSATTSSADCSHTHTFTGSSGTVSVSGSVTI